MKPLCHDRGFLPHVFISSYMQPLQQVLAATSVAPNAARIPLSVSYKLQEEESNKSYSNILDELTYKDISSLHIQNMKPYSWKQSTVNRAAVLLFKCLSSLLSLVTCQTLNKRNL